ncbi:MAG: bacillithiol biosynthesis deacetylase BshB1 [Flammeovirgaceae bacterium]|nr:bacillithiol biosynthesis deacetylase BshB1 [Flammeovirgaceae bacterium]MBE62087.1 bacillithiol biosynthesis deacetylase BshB1 [Flammeovirgaceae bacterium]MBR10816.1 bacillithiol biosynthesis deacetylase BshB1 [Rickettsiales bacterium]HCX20848.1 bacillithiol biosynthesis deacetylase BshB1 [Cytophagales bacterium]|tara:strand:+ start:1692 stop:2411 length:720 start_codon:yes stop_codon:yes gene_type:complete
MKINILAIAAHPDDVELSCAGTLIAHKDKGYTTGVIDLTRGEMGTRGTPEQRIEEATEAGKIMGLSVRENMEFEDAFFTNDKAHQMALIQKIRKYQPDIVITNTTYDRHPDHARGAQLVEEACFKAGLAKIETLNSQGDPQKPWRPKKVYYVIQSTSLSPNFFVDISTAQERKMEAIRAYGSQFFDPNSKEPETYIAKPEFMNMVESRAVEYGHRIGVKYAEGFITKEFIGVKDLYNLS